jgi:hypothetical protein
MRGGAKLCAIRKVCQLVGQTRCKCRFLACSCSKPPPILPMSWIVTVLSDPPVLAIAPVIPHLTRPKRPPLISDPSSRKSAR